MNIQLTSKATKEEGLTPTVDGSLRLPPPPPPPAAAVRYATLPEAGFEPPPPAAEGDTATPDPAGAGAAEDTD